MNARIAWRGLRRSPLHGVAIVLLLVVGIAAVAVVFAVTEKAIISPLAVEQPEALVALGRLSYPNYRSFVDRLEGVSGVAAFVNQPLTFTEREPERLRGAFVTATTSGCWASPRSEAVRSTPRTRRGSPSSASTSGVPPGVPTPRSSAARCG